MADIPLVREIESQTNELDAERMAQVEIPRVGSILITVHGRPLMILEAEDTENGVLINLSTTPNAQWHNQMTHRHMAIELQYKEPQDAVSETK